MGRSIRRSPSLKMNSKICLILFGLLVALAVLSAAENSEENSLSALSEEVASARLTREAEAGKRKRNNKAKRSKKNKKNKKKGKKAKKGKKGKKAKKGRKNKKGKNRKNRKGKKSKKNKKGKRKGRKNNRGKKRNNKNRGNRKNGNRKSARTVNGKCLETAMLGMNRWRLVVANFNKQKTRIAKQAEIAKKKEGKKAVFAPIALKLVDLGGGNKSALSCSGSTTSSGAKQLTNLTNTLFACEVAVNKSCSTSFPAPNKTFVDACATDIKLFETLAAGCYSLSKEATADKACTCWTAPEFTISSEKVKSCKISSTASIAAGLKSCKEAFSKCRKYEDDAVASMAACSVTSAALKAKAAALYANSQTVTSVQTKVKGITGSRAGGRAAATTCAAFIKLVTKLAGIVSSFPSSSQVGVVGGYITSSTVTCTTAEKTSLKTAEASLKTAAVTLTEALAE